MQKNSLRVRFAPSPTGHLHIGGLRTALFNWLYARHMQGSFLLRIEDTDLERSKPEYVASILASLKWADIAADEPVVTQTDFINEHKKLIDQLISKGKAYKCYCPHEAYDADSFKKYAKACRLKVSSDLDQPYVVRLRLPDRDTISFNDLIRGDITFDMDQYDDFIIARSDGTPVYNFVVVADDHAMGITHVIRGEDHISNTPKQILIYEALGYQLPQFAHLPLILNEQGGRLSKRDAATNVMEYKELGILPEALMNYLVRLGWAHGDQEIFSREELIHYFTLEAVGKKGSVFDMQKLRWMNGMYMRSHTADYLIAYSERELGVDFVRRYPSWDAIVLSHAVALYKERADTLVDLMHELDRVYSGDQPVHEAEVQAHCTADTAAHLAALMLLLESAPAFDHDALKQIVQTFTKEKNLKLVAIAQPIRLALTGKTASPGVFDIMSLLGKKETIARLQKFIKIIAR